MNEPSIMKQLEDHERRIAELEKRIKVLEARVIERGHPMLTLEGGRLEGRPYTITCQQ